MPCPVTREAKPVRRTGALLVLGLAAGCQSQGERFDCRCRYLTDYDDPGAQRVEVCARGVGDAPAAARGCAQSAAPAPVQSCECVAAGAAEACQLGDCRPRAEQ